MRDVQDFGVDLLRRLEGADMSARALAQRSEISVYNIHTYINDGVIPSMKTLLRLDMVLPGLVEDWGDAVAEYFSTRARKRAQTIRANTVDKPRAGRSKTQGKKSRYGPAGSLAEVCRAARKAGMTYGQYVAANSVAGKG